MRILYIDPFCPYGHLALNRLYVSTLVNEGFDVSLAFKEGYYEAMGAPGGTLKVAAPARLYDERAKRIAARFNAWRALQFIRFHVDEGDYDVIFFSSYEEISLWASRFSTHCVLLNHANVAGLDHPVRRWFARRLARNSTGLVFAEFIRQRALLHGIHHVQVVPQGLVERYPSGRVSEGVLRSIDWRLVTSKWRHLVFVPSAAKYADTFIVDTVTDLGFQQFLRDRGILLIVKSRDLRCAAENVLAISSHLTTEQYGALFSASTCLVLHYPASFTYRVSATLMECFSNKKPCLLSDIESFRAFAGKFRYDPFYGSRTGLCIALERLVTADKVLSDPYRDLDDQVPSFRVLAREWRGACNWGGHGNVPAVR